MSPLVIQSSSRLTLLIFNTQSFLRHESFASLKAKYLMQRNLIQRISKSFIKGIFLTIQVKNSDLFKPIFPQLWRFCSILLKSHPSQLMLPVAFWKKISKYTQAKPELSGHSLSWDVQGQSRKPWLLSSENKDAFSNTSKRSKCI